MNRKTIALLSGGLDSTLAIKILLEQGMALFIVSATNVREEEVRHLGCKFSLLGTSANQRRIVSSQ